MRKRDLGIVLLVAFVVFFSLQHEGDFSFRKAWYHLSDQDYPIKYEADRLPPPLVTNLNGDSNPEILLPTHDAKIQVLQPHYSRTLDDAGAFHEARLMADISLLPDNIRVSSGRRLSGLRSKSEPNSDVEWSDPRKSVTNTGTN